MRVATERGGCSWIERGVYGGCLGRTGCACRLVVGGGGFYM